MKIYKIQSTFPKRAISMFVFLCVVYCPYIAVIANTENQSLPVEIAIQESSKPTWYGGNGVVGATPQLQAICRLEKLRVKLGYRFTDGDKGKWRVCLLDPLRDPYAKLCAAFYIMEDPLARDYVEKMISSSNFRYRFNAAAVLSEYVGSDYTKIWGINTLLKSIAFGFLDDPQQVTLSGSYPEYDAYDVRSPMNLICYRLGGFDLRSSAPIYISALNRMPLSAGPAVALKGIEDHRIVSILMRVYGNEVVNGVNPRSSVQFVFYLLKDRQLPGPASSIIDRLENSSMSEGEVLACLDALAEVGGEEILLSLEKFLKNNEDSRIIDSAGRRVLAQLESPDPVATLISLYNSQSGEKEKLSLLLSLGRYQDERVVKELKSLIDSSASNSVRLSAIVGLSGMGTKESLLALASLLGDDLPGLEKSRAESWLSFPMTISDFIEAELRATTKQDFGKNSTQWTRWIADNDPSK